MSSNTLCDLHGFARAPRAVQADDDGQRHTESAGALQDTGGGVPLNDGPCVRYRTDGEKVCIYKVLLAASGYS